MHFLHTPNLICVTLGQVLYHFRVAGKEQMSCNTVFFSFCTAWPASLSYNTFFSFQDNLLASGANNSEIYIWDLNNFNMPMTPGTKSQVGSFLDKEKAPWNDWG